MSTIADELAIRTLVTRYADAVNRRDEKDWGATWADDGVWLLPGAGEVAGRENVVDMWLNAMSGFPFVVQLIYHGLVDVNGDQGTGRWTLAEYLKLSDGSGMFNLGVYQDQYVKIDGEWKFARRNYSVLYNDNSVTALPGECMPFPDLL